MLIGVVVLFVRLFLYFVYCLFVVSCSSFCRVVCCLLIVVCVSFVCLFLYLCVCLLFGARVLSCVAFCWLYVRC